MKKTVVMLFLVFMSCLPSILTADFRYYAWTYGFMTMLPGNVEIEIYNAYTEPVKGWTGGAYWERQFEMETGVMDRWDFSFYMTDTRVVTSSNTNTGEIKMRTRFKLTEKKNDFIVDPLLYAEYRVRFNRLYPDTWEFRGVFAKDIGSFHAVVNLIAEEVLSNTGLTKFFDFGYAAGASYPVFNEAFRIGVESIGDISAGKYYLGPAISYKGAHIWGAITPAFGLNSRSDYIKIQAVVGVVFDLTLNPPKEF